MASIVIPAHNEARLIGDLLTSLTAEPWDGEIVVVANGCSDGTADVVRQVPGVRLIETSIASKAGALALGDRSVSRFPRFYVDGDVVLGVREIRELSAALEVSGVHAVGPVRRLAMRHVSPAVRAYYAVWRRLPGVTTELYGRGVVGVDEVGHARLAPWRDVMSDDLFVAMSFAPAEVRVVRTAQVLIRPPRRYRDLLRRRTRVTTGNWRLAHAPETPRVRKSTSARTLMTLLRQDPRLAPAVGIFITTALLARAWAGWATFRGSTAWLRDESSRVPLLPRRSES